MTILHIIIGLDGGGAEHMVLELANESQKAGHKVLVVAMSQRKLILNKFNKKNIECHFINITSIKTLYTGLKKLKQIHYKNNNEMVFHCHMFHSLIVGLLYKIFLKNTPIVYTMHTNKVKQLYRRLLLYISKPFRNSDIIFSENSKKWYLKNNCIIPNGVDLSKFESIQYKEKIKQKPFVFLFLGRLTTPKNPLVLIDLVNYLKSKNYNNFLINVVGDGILRETLEAGIKQYKINDYIKLNGFQSNVSKFLSEAHCLIIPSLWEGMPVSIIEAGASKLPVISTPVGSIPDFLNNENAYLLDLVNFQKGMIAVMENYNVAGKKGELLFNLVKANYDIKKIGAMHLELYKKQFHLNKHSNSF